MANFVENVDFTVNDKSTIDRFHVELTFAFNVSDYLENDGFRITIRDLLTHKDLLITSDDLLYGDGYGLVPITDVEINEETKAKQINDSLIENEGLVIFLTGYNILTIIMIPRCTKANKTIGFYSSNVFIQFTDDESVNSITFYANLFPKMIRNETIVQNEEIDDPVLKDMNIRPAFDFNMNIDKNVERLFNYDTKKIFYANTTSKEYKDDEVPVYISTISAMGIDNVDKAIYDFNYDWEHAESYLVDESNGQKYDIDYTVENPDSYEFEPVPGFKTTVDDYLITQYIYKETPGFYKNKLVFNLENIPTDTALESLRVTIEDLNPARFNSMDISGTANIKIYNPNVDYRTLDILTSGFMEDLFENIDAEIDYDGIDTSRYETYGEVTVPLKNICFDLPEGTKKAKGQFGFEAWLDIHDIEKLTPEEIKDITRGWDSTMIDYYTEAPKLIPLSAEIVNWDPKYADNTIIPGESETISVKITNLNLDYLSDIAISCTWNGTDKTDSIINEDTSHYLTDHYITFDVENLEASEMIDTYDFVVTGYINDEDLEVEPPIIKEKMKTETMGSTSMRFNLYNENLEPLVFDIDSIVYDPELHIDDEGNLVKQIKKNTTQSFTIVLNNPNIKYRNLELYPVKVDIITGDDYFVGAEATLSYDDNYSEQSDLGGKMTVTVTNMHIDVLNVKKKIKLHAYINASDIHHSQSEFMTETETYYVDEEWWMMEDPVIPYEWEFMKDCVIYTNSILRTNNSYIGVKTIRCAGANFETTNIQSDIYCYGDLIINNLNQNPNKAGYFPMDTSDYTSQSNPSLNFVNNGKLQYNYVHGTDKVPNLYYYYNPDSEHPERNSRFENGNNSVIGNNPWAGYIADGGMIMRDEDYVLKDIPELDVFPSTDTTKNIHVPQLETYVFTQDDSNYYDSEKKIFRVYNFSTANQATVTFNPGEYHFKSWNRCETQLTIVIPKFEDDEYVKIFVEDTIDISNSLKIINNNVNRFDEDGYLRCDSLLIYTKNGDIKFAASNTKEGYDKQIGILVAPNGTIELSNTCIWRGSTWAKNINVLADSEYHIT